MSMLRFVVVSNSEAVERGWNMEPVIDSDWWWELYDLSTSPPTWIARDHGEPEDQSFPRDWSWVAPLLNQLDAQRNEAEWQLQKAIDCGPGNVCGTVGTQCQKCLRVMFHNEVARANQIQTILRDTCMRHNDDCMCDGCTLAFRKG